MFLFHYLVTCGTGGQDLVALKRQKMPEDHPIKGIFCREAVIISEQMMRDRIVLMIFRVFSFRQLLGSFQER